MRKYNLFSEIYRTLLHGKSHITEFAPGYSKLKIKLFYNHIKLTIFKEHDFYTEKNFYNIYEKLTKKWFYKYLLNTIKNHYKIEHKTIRKFLKETKNYSLSYKENQALMKKNPYSYRYYDKCEQ